jgi:tripartite ATP-independent transporter DctP family solute receptor
MRCARRAHTLEIEHLVGGHAIMGRGKSIIARWCSVFLASTGLIAALAAGATPAAAPAASAPKPAAEPATPTGEPAAPMAQPAKRVAQPAKRAAQLAQAAAPKGRIEIAAGSGNPKGDILSDGVDKFAEIVKERSKGDIVVTVHYQSLGAEQQLLQTVMMGGADIGHIGTGNSARFTNVYYPFDLPFVFKTNDQMLRALKSPLARQIFDQYEKDAGVKWLFALSFGAGRAVQTRNKPVKVPADIKGLKMRVTGSPVNVATMRAWGANPTQVDWGQIFSALLQGVVDGYDNQLTSSYGLKHYEAIKYAVDINYQLTFNTVFMNQHKFQSLSSEHQKIILEAAKEAEEWQHNWARGSAAKIIPAMREKGMTIHEPTAEEYAQWASVRDKVWQEVAGVLQGKVDLERAKQLSEVK